jgi:hypothetical protein
LDIGAYSSASPAGASVVLAGPEPGAAIEVISIVV